MRYHKCPARASRQLRARSSLCVSECALELRSFFLCVCPKGRSFWWVSRACFSGGVYGCGKNPSYAMLLGAFGCVTLSPLEEAYIQGDGPDLTLSSISRCSRGVFHTSWVLQRSATRALLDTTMSKTGLFCRTLQCHKNPPEEKTTLEHRDLGVKAITLHIGLLQKT